MRPTKRYFLIGLITSLILPALFMFVFISLRYQGTLGVIQVLKELFRFNQLSGLLAIGAFPNLFLFLYAMHKENWLLGRGVVSATLLYGVIVMIFRFL